MAAFTFDAWRDDLLNGKPPVLWKVGDGELAKLPIGPGRVVLLVQGHGRSLSVQSGCE